MAEMQQSDFDKKRQAEIRKAALELGESYEEDDDQEVMATIYANLNAHNNSAIEEEQDDECSPNIQDKKVTKHKPQRIMSQKNPRGSKKPIQVMSETNGRPNTKHVQQRQRGLSSANLSQQQQINQRNRQQFQKQGQPQFFASNTEHNVFDFKDKFYDVNRQNSQTIPQFYPQTQTEKQSFPMPVKALQSGSASLSAAYSLPVPEKARRQVIQQIINNNGSGNILFNGSNLQTQHQAMVEKRYSTVANKNLKQNQPSQNNSERDEIKNQHRNLKVQFNLIADENIRLKTRIQSMAIELQKAEKTMESLMKSLHNDKNLTQPKQQYTETFLVSQLKKQNRQQLLDLQTKEQDISNLKKSIKLAKMREADSDQQAYLEECQRLRTLLQQQVIANDILTQKLQSQSADQQPDSQQNPPSSQQLQLIQEEQVVQSENNMMRVDMEEELVQSRLQISKLKERIKQQDLKTRKYNECLLEFKRQHKIITDKQHEIDEQKVEIARLGQIQTRFYKINETNKELVLRKCALESQNTTKEKIIQEQKDRLAQLEKELKNGNNQLAQSNYTSVTSNQSKIEKLKSRVVHPVRSQQSKQVSTDQIVSKSKPLQQTVPAQKETTNQRSIEVIGIQQPVQQDENHQNSEYEPDYEQPGTEQKLESPQQPAFTITKKRTSTVLPSDEDPCYDKQEEQQEYVENIEQEQIEQNDQELQITEDQMLDISETVFHVIAQCLAHQGLTVMQTFGEDDIIHVLDTFEGEQNVEVMTADDFFTRCYQIGVPELTQIQMACLIRVIGKPELSNGIRLSELEMVLQNFLAPNTPSRTNETPQDGSTFEQHEEAMTQLERRRQSMVELFENDAELTQVLVGIAQDPSIEEKLSQQAYIQIVKSKNKQNEVPAITSENFQAITSLTDEQMEKLRPILAMHAKFADIFQVKHCLMLFQDVIEFADSGNVEQEQNEVQSAGFQFQENQEET